MEKADFMREAIRLASDNVRSGGGPFGAVIVKEGKIVATGVNRVTSHIDPTAHAEVNAIREACRILNTFDLSDCEIYSSCEPCPMCLGAVYWARLSRLVFANTKEDAKNIGFDDSFIYKEIELSYDKRAIPTEQFLRDEAIATFKLWEEKSDKIEY